MVISKMRMTRGKSRRKNARILKPEGSFTAPLIMSKKGIIKIGKIKKIKGIHKTQPVATYRKRKRNPLEKPLEKEGFVSSLFEARKIKAGLEIYLAIKSKIVKRRNKKAMRIIKARCSRMKIKKSFKSKDGGETASSLLGRLILKFVVEPLQPTKNPKIQSILYFHATSQDFLTTAQ